MAIASGMSAPAPSPWIPRASTSWVIDCAVAPTTPPAMNSTIPQMKNSRRPCTSDSRP